MSLVGAAIHGLDIVDSHLDLVHGDAGTHYTGHDHDEEGRLLDHWIAEEIRYRLFEKRRFLLGHRRWWWCTSSLGLFPRFLGFFRLFGVDFDAVQFDGLVILQFDVTRFHFIVKFDLFLRVGVP